MEEHIVLESLEVDASSINPVGGEQRKIGYRLHCHGPKAKRKLCHSLFNRHFIQTEFSLESQAGEQGCLAYHLGFLSPDYHQHWAFNRALAIACSVALLLAVASGLLAIWVMMIPSACIALALALGTLKSFEKQAVFTSQAAHAPLVFVSFKSKKTELVEKFLQQLSAEIAQNPLPEGLNRLPEETKLLRQFYQAGYFNKDDYEFYKGQVFKSYPSAKPLPNASAQDALAS